MADINIEILKEYQKGLSGIEAGIDRIVNKMIELDKQTGAAAKNVGKGAKTTKKEVEQADALTKKLTQQEAKLKQLEDSRSITIAKNNEAIKKRNQSLRQEAQYGKVAADSLVKQRQKLRELTHQYDAASAAQRQKLGPAVKQLSKQIEEQEKATNRNQRAVGRYSDAMAAAPGPLGRATTAMKTFGAAMKTAAGPIILVIGAITGIVKAMTRSEEGANRLKRVMAFLGGAFGAILDVVTDFGIRVFDAFKNPQQAIADFGKFLLNNVINRFKGIAEAAGSLAKIFVRLFDRDFKGAKEAAGELGQNLIQVVTGFDEMQQSGILEFTKDLKEEIKNDANESLRLAKVREDLLVKEREWLIERQKLTNQVNEGRAALDDENITLEDKIALNERAIALTDKIAAGEDELRALRLSAAREQAAINASDTEALDEIARLEQEQLAAESERLLARKRLLAEQKRLTNERLKMVQDSNNMELEMEREFQEELDDELDNELEKYSEQQEEKNRIQQESQEKMSAVVSGGEQVITNIISRSQQNQLAALDEKKTKGLISEEEYEKQKASLEKKAAQRNKIIQIGKIILEQLVATSEWNFARALTAGAALVTAIATPAYAMGTDYAEKAFLYGEAGPELGRKKDGSFFFADKPTFIDDPSYLGAKIWNAGETKQILSGESGGKSAGFDAERIVRAINSKPETKINISPAGIRYATKKGNNWIIRMKRL